MNSVFLPLDAKDAIARSCAVINGFRILEVIAERTFPFYAVRPNRSDHTFFFVDFRRAADFANHFRNCHDAAFWFKRWHRVHSYNYVRQLCSFESSTLNY